MDGYNELKLSELILNITLSLAEIVWSYSPYTTNIWSNDQQNVDLEEDAEQVDVILKRSYWQADILAEHKSLDTKGME